MKEVLEYYKRSKRYLQQVLNNINQAEQICTEVSSSMSYNNNFYMGWVYGWGLWLIHIKRFFSWCSTFRLTQYTSIPKFTFYSDSVNKIHSLETMKGESANANYPIIIYLLKAHLHPLVIVVVCFYNFWISLLSTCVIWLAECTQAVRKGRDVVLYSPASND